MVDLRRLRSPPRASPTTARWPPRPTRCTSRRRPSPSSSPRWSARSGRRLLEPAGRSVRLTPAAHVLLEPRRRAVRPARAAGGRPGGADAAPRGEVRVGGFPTALAGLLAPAARPLRAIAPAVELRILEAETPEAVAALVAPRRRRDPRHGVLGRAAARRCALSPRGAARRHARRRARRPATRSPGRARIDLDELSREELGRAAGRLVVRRGLPRRLPRRRVHARRSRTARATGRR